MDYWVCDGYFVNIKKISSKIWHVLLRHFLESVTFHDALHLHHDVCYYQPIRRSQLLRSTLENIHRMLMYSNIYLVIDPMWRHDYAKNFCMSWPKYASITWSNVLCLVLWCVVNLKKCVVFSDVLCIWSNALCLLIDFNRIYCLTEK